MPHTTLKLTLVIGIEGNPHAQQDIGANPCVRNKNEGNPRARRGIGSNPMTGTTLEQNLVSCIILLITLVPGTTLEVTHLLEFTLLCQLWSHG